MKFCFGLNFLGFELKFKQNFTHSLSFSPLSCSLVCLPAFSLLRAVLNGLQGRSISEFITLICLSYAKALMMIVSQSFRKFFIKNSNKFKQIQKNSKFPKCFHLCLYFAYPFAKCALVSLHSRDKVERIDLKALFCA